MVTENKTSALKTLEENKKFHNLSEEEKSKDPKWEKTYSPVLKKQIWTRKQ